MKHKKILVALTTAVLLGAGLATHADEKQAQPKKQTVCPVMGGKINKANHVDVNGRRIYACCPDCIAKIKAAPKKYIKQIEKQGIELEKPPTKEKTPVSTGGCGGCCSQ